MADSPLRILSLCSGVGGFELGVRIAAPNAVTVGYAEIEAYAASVLAARIADGCLDAAPIWLGDLRELDPTPWRGLVDCIIGGYPCQPFSHAGQRRGNDDERSLWGGIAELIADLKPGRCFFENVSGHLSLGFDQVGADLQSMGYCVAAGIFSAAEVGASHRRERLFIMADRESDAGRVHAGRRLPGEGAAVAGRQCETVGHTQGNRRREGRPEPEFRRGRDAIAEHGGELADPDSERRQQIARSASGDEEAHGRDGDHQPERNGESVADNDCGGPQDIAGIPAQRRESNFAYGEFPIFAPGPADPRWRDILADAPHLEPAVRNLASRHADWMGGCEPIYRVDQLRALGNGVVPLTAAFAWATLSERLAK